MLSPKVFLDTFWVPLPALTKRIMLALIAALVIAVVAIFSQSSGSSNVSASDWLPTASFGSASSSAPSASISGNDSTSATSIEGNAPLSAKVMVQVVGAVLYPGVYSLPLGSRVIDAVFAAGGFAAGADQASLNLARPINDGEQLVLLKFGQQNSQTTSAGSLVNVNLSDASKLDSLPGIGPTLAQRIIDYRTANGGFRSLGDLGKVAGIGPTLLEKLKPLVSL